MNHTYMHDLSAFKTEVINLFACGLFLLRQLFLGKLKVFESYFLVMIKVHLESKISYCTVLSYDIE